MSIAARILRSALIALATSAFLAGCSTAGRSTTKQESLDEWRSLTSLAAASPRAFVKGGQVQLCFTTQVGVEVFKAHWTRGRIPTSGYRVTSALLRWDQRLSDLPREHRSWREATVITGAKWRELAVSLFADLTPSQPNHAASYQAFLAGGVCYRDTAGRPHYLPLSEQPTNAVIEHEFTIEETLEMMARSIDTYLARAQPNADLFLLIAPASRKPAQPLLVDRRQRRCVLLNPAALYDFTEQGLTGAAAVQGLAAILPEAHGLALLKSPVSSAARLADLGIASGVRLLRLPLPGPGSYVPPLAERPGMDLRAWESWLNRYTGTRLEEGALKLRINGDGFFPVFEDAIAAATNSVHLNIYIFDRDDVAVSIADRLKSCSERVDVKVLFDRLGSIGGGQAPPVSPMPEDFVPPASIGAYLQQGSNVRVRKFLNPWFSSTHVKVLLVDGTRGWLGGMNFGREYRYEWHDLMVEVTGPILTSLEAEFRRSWAHAGPWGDLGYLAAALSKPKEGPAVPCSEPWMKLRRLPTATLWKPFSTAVLNSFRQAQSYIYVENPYLFDKRVILGLVRARNRGVDVRVILPRVNDFKAAGRASLVVANYLLQHGVRVYFHPGMTHVKALLVDDWACLGSGNLNHLSLRVNQEENIATSDDRFVTELRREVFEKDFSRSHELTRPIAVEWVDILADLLLEGL